MDGIPPLSPSRIKSDRDAHKYSEVWTKCIFGRKSRKDGEHDSGGEAREGRTVTRGLKANQDERKGVLSLKPLVFLA